MWDFKETYAVETKKEKLKEVIQDDYIIIEVPARVGGGAGMYSLRVGLKKRADEVRIEKILISRSERSFVGGHYEN